MTIKLSIMHDDACKTLNIIILKDILSTFDYLPVVIITEELAVSLVFTLGSEVFRSTTNEEVNMQWFCKAFMFAYIHTSLVPCSFQQSSFWTVVINQELDVQRPRKEAHSYTPKIHNKLLNCKYSYAFTYVHYQECRPWLDHLQMRLQVLLDYLYCQRE